MSEGVQTSVPAEAREIKALLGLVQRTPMTDAEACFIEDLFSRWFSSLNQQANAAEFAKVATEGGLMAGDGGPAPAGQLETTASQPDQPADEPGDAGAASDVLSGAQIPTNVESPPDAASGPENSQTD